MDNKYWKHPKPPRSEEKIEKLHSNSGVSVHQLVRDSDFSALANLTRINLLNIIHDKKRLWSSEDQEINR